VGRKRDRNFSTCFKPCMFTSMGKKIQDLNSKVG
jgi:hypothetical protein